VTEPHTPAGEPSSAGIHSTAVLAEGVELGEDVAVGPFAVIGRGTRLHAGVRVGSHVVIGARCEVGAGSELHPHATLYSDVVLGPGSVVRSGACLGPDGFGFAFAGGAHRKIAQVGGCRVGERCTFGANSTVDRGSVGHTVLGDWCAVGPLVQVGHNARLGSLVGIGPQVAVAGSTTLGDGVSLGGQVAIAGHLTVGEGVSVARWGGVTQEIPPGQAVSGTPAHPRKETRRAEALLYRLPRLVRRLRALERAVRGAAG
jgi:UDP-3-O-[3-hydroxymyristoyl] glucosamine N-acyltransferase